MLLPVPLFQLLPVGALQLIPEQGLPKATRQAMLSSARSTGVRDKHAAHLVYVSPLQRLCQGSVCCCICWYACHVSACMIAAIITRSCVLLLLLRCLMVLWRLLGIRGCCLLLA